MTKQSLYDMSPVAWMLLIGLLIALLPLLWVWRRHQGSTPARRLQALTLMTLFLTFDLVLFGAFTRLSDSGLGCPDWPGCYGSSSPWGAQQAIASAESAMPTGPVTQSKAWVEMVHRYLASGVGFLILLLAVASWCPKWAKLESSIRKPWWASFTLFWVCLQGAFGALTVTMKLFPAIVTLHLLGGMVLLALLCAQWVWQSQRLNRVSPTQLNPNLRHLLWLGLAVLVIQIALGAWVSSNYAVLACNEFPKCQNSWWPLMNFQHGFELWRELGHTQAGAVIGFESLTAIHYVHRMMAGLVSLLLLTLAWRLSPIAGLRGAARWLAGLIGLQFVTGLSNVVLDWPLVAALLHTGGAAALVLVMTWTLCFSQAEKSVQHAAQSTA
ncbi:MAG: COX15/CtaA family protein [Burkholderiaceae bacterium]